MRDLFNNEFAVGDKIKVINAKVLPGNEFGPLLLENDAHRIDGVFKCPCGQEHLSIGLKSNFNFIRCYRCGENLPSGEVTQWCHPSRFKMYEDT